MFKVFQHSAPLDATFVLIFIDVLIKTFNRSTGHLLFQNIFHLSVIFKIPQLLIAIQFLQL